MPVYLVPVPTSRFRFHIRAASTRREAMKPVDVPATSGTGNGGSPMWTWLIFGGLALLAYVTFERMRVAQKRKRPRWGARP